MSILYFIVQYLPWLIAGSMNANIIFYSPLSTLSIAGLMNINIIFYSPISTFFYSMVNEYQYYIVYCIIHIASYQGQWMSILYSIVQYPHYLIAESMNVNIIFYSPISTLSDSRVNECQYLILKYSIYIIW